MARPALTVSVEIKRSNPQIISIDAPSVVARGTSFYIRIKATDTGGVITSYLWAVEENTFSRLRIPPLLSSLSINRVRKQSE